MKNLLITFMILWLLPLSVMAQPNMVPNGNFEDIIHCPTPQNSHNIEYCIGWRSFGTSIPGFFNSCAGTGGNSVPQNHNGFQHAASGNGYIALSAHALPATWRRYATRPIVPLKKGYVYEVSLSASVTEVSTIFIDDIGVYFYDSGLTQHNTQNIVAVNPQVHYGSYGLLTDTQNWVRMTGFMYADSAYDNIALGSFKPANQVDTQHTGFHTNLALQTYLFYDSIVVRPTTAITINFTDTVLCTGDTIRVPYEVDAFRILGSNNVYTLQLSDDTGGFTNPVNIGTLASTSRNDTIKGIIPANTVSGAGYILRLVSSNNPDTSFYKKLDNYNTGIKIGNRAKPAILSNTPLCSGQTLQFTSTINAGQSLSWTGPNSFTSTVQNPAIANTTTAMSGQYILTVSKYGCTSADTETVVINPSLQPIVATVTSPVCAGDTVKLFATNTSPSGATYSWTGPNGFSTSAQNTARPNSTTAMSGDYIVTAERSGCTAKDTVTALVKPQPAAINVTGNSPVCSGDTLYINSTASSSGVNYSWAGPNSFTAATQNSFVPNSSTAATGWYVMTAGLNGCNIKDSLYAVVNQTPATPSVTFNSPLCVGETLSLSTGAISGAAYVWTGPNNFSSSQQNPARNNMQFGDTGTYSVTATINGCTSQETSTTVKINPTPFVVILANPADSICQGSPVLFTAYPNNHGGTPQYQWLVNGIASGSGTVFSSSALNHQDIVRCEMTENTKCSVPHKDESNDVTMNVLPWLAPSVSISANPAHPLDAHEYVTFTAVTTNAGNNPTFQWKRNGQNIVGATGSVWSANTLNDNDSIAVAIISNYKCPQPTTASSNWIRIKMTGFGDVIKNGAMVVYPNPNKGKFVLEAPFYPKEQEHLNLEVINTLGQVVYSDKIISTNGNLRKEIDLGNIANGVYLLRLHTNAGVSVARVTVQ